MGEGDEERNVGRASVSFPGPFTSLLGIAVQNVVR
jgi:hypothetical protein